MFKKILEKFPINLGKVCRKFVEFQNKFRERLKVKTSELWNLHQVEMNEINILKTFQEKFRKILQTI